MNDQNIKTIDTIREEFLSDPILEKSIEILNRLLETSSNFQAEIDQRY